MYMMRFVVTFLCFCFLAAHPLTAEDNDLTPGDHLNRFLVQVDRDHLDELAKDHGLELEDEQYLEELGFYSVVHPEVSVRSRRSADDHLARLKSDPRVREVSQLKVLDRVKREIIYDKQKEFPVKDIEDPSVFYRAPVSHLETRKVGASQKIDDNCVNFNDQYYVDEWYICNEGQTGGKRDVDLRVGKPWTAGYTGKGIKVLVLDDGLDHRHPDLRDNYDPEISADFNSLDEDPTPDTSTPYNSHGTRCAGEIAAAANNSVCTVGIAYRASIGAIRLLDGAVTDDMEARAMTHKLSQVDIYSASWGPRDDGKTMERPHSATRAALAKGVAEGRGGKGVLYMWATGNGGIYDDCCGADGYVSSRETISIGSINDRGNPPCFMEICSSTMAVVPSGGDTCDGSSYMLPGRPKIKVVTTDINGGCVLNFEGTSSAAPMAAGVMAVTLEANPELTWRDVLYIIALTARIPIVEQNKWHVNGGGFHTNHELGFGVLDVSTMVVFAQKWSTVPDEHMCHTPTIHVETEIESNKCVNQTVVISSCQNDPNRRINFLEHVMLYVNLDHTRRGDIEIIVYAPTGTISYMLFRRPNDNSKAGIDFTFMSVHHWGEDASGEWTVSVCDNDGGKGHHNQGQLHSVNMTFYGIYLKDKPRSTYAPYDPSKQEQLSMIKKEKEVYKKSTIVKRKDAVNKNKHKNLNKKVQDKELTSQELSDIISDLERELKDKKINLGSKIRGKKTHASSNGEKRKYENEHVDVLKKHFGDDVEKGEDEYIAEILNEIEGLVEENENSKRREHTERYLRAKRWSERPTQEELDDLQDE